MSSLDPQYGFDISPTTPLPGLHLRGIATRRFLISYPVAPEALSRFIPPGAMLSTNHGLAWVSARFVNFQRMRPSFSPAPFGIEFNYLVHRTRAQIRYPDGKRRESVLVLEPNISSTIFAAAGQRTTGVRFQPRKIKLRESTNLWRVQMSDAKGALLFRADIPKRSIGKTLPENSRFDSLEDADKFLLNVSYGTEWHKQEHTLLALAETHDPWQALVGSAKTDHFAFLQAITPEPPQADHVITMVNIPHYFALHGSEIKV